MDVEFCRTGVRRYAVRATPSGCPTLVMDPAPGYDSALPHDLVHYVVEEELGLSRGVFGQLAAGGDAGTFYLPPPSAHSRGWTRMKRRIKKRGEKLAAEGRSVGEFSERAASICHHEWLAHSEVARSPRAAAQAASSLARAWSLCSDAERNVLSPAVIARICARFDELSARWSELDVGESITLTWRPPYRSAAQPTPTAYALAPRH